MEEEFFNQYKIKRTPCGVCGMTSDVGGCGFCIFVKGDRSKITKHKYCTSFLNHCLVDEDDECPPKTQKNRG